MPDTTTIFNRSSFRIWTIGLRDELEAGLVGLGAGQADNAPGRARIRRSTSLLARSSGYSERALARRSPKNPPIASKSVIKMMKLSMHAIEGFLAALVSLVRAVFFDLLFALTSPVRIHVSLLAGWHYPRDICRCSCESHRRRQRRHFEGGGIRGSASEGICRSGSTDLSRAPEADPPKPAPSIPFIAEGLSHGSFRRHPVGHHTQKPADRVKIWDKQDEALYACY